MILPGLKITDPTKHDRERHQNMRIVRNRKDEDSSMTFVAISSVKNGVGKRRIHAVGYSGCTLE